MKQLCNKAFDLLARIDYGVKKAAANARLEHKLAGRPIIVFENGKVTAIPAKDIEIHDHLLPPSPI